MLLKPLHLTMHAVAQPLLQRSNRLIELQINHAAIGSPKLKGPCVDLLRQAFAVSLKRVIGVGLAWRRALRRLS